MRTSRFFLAIVGFLILLTIVIPVHGQDNSPWGEILNPDGSIRWDQLTDLGMTKQQVSWMGLDLPGGIHIPLDATYHRYQTSSGNVLVLPSPATLFFMALHPGESHLNNAYSMLGDNAAALEMLVGPSLSSEQLAQIAIKGYTDPRQFFRAVIDGRENIWSIVNRTYLLEVLSMSIDSGYIVHALLLYLTTGGDCEAIPGGCPNFPGGPGNPGGGWNPGSSSCPSPSMTQAKPTLQIQKVAPSHPLVVGQDPGKRGADIEGEATVPPVILTWYEEIHDPLTCDAIPDGKGGGCPGPGSRYSGGWSSDKENNPNWQVGGGEVHCNKHVETLPEPITSVKASADLSPASRYWILTDLASKYYQAYIHQATFELVPGLGYPAIGCGNDGVCKASFQADHVPFADPGIFNLTLSVQTGGAIFYWKGSDIPITPPRVLEQENTLQVFLTLVTLVPGGGQ
ncbi:MAG: hypothetical protein PHQ40_08660 [Anaerolineaceae bacterium]|nr:hypothetical protein [Anaerolineaceae bacterium]